MLKWFRFRKRAPVERRSNEEWLAALDGPGREQALGELRGVLVRGLRIFLAGRVPRQAGALAEDFAQEALLRILENLGSFRGESRFLTWAEKIAARVALTELRRKQWENVSLEDLMPDEAAGSFTPPALADAAPGPDDLAAHRMLAEQVLDLMQTVLTERQRTAIMAVVVQDMPMEEVARRMNTNRNALYKLLHDARLRLKAEMERRGMSPEDILRGL